MTASMRFPTRYGNIIDFQNPTASSIDIRDISFSLAHICRFNGHSKFHYSVAQHSVLVGKQFPDPTERLYATLHDAPEFATGDITSPFKRYLEFIHPGIIRGVEDRLDAAIHEYFGLAWPLPDGLHAKIKLADRKALATEIRDLTKTKHSEKLLIQETLPEPFPEHITPLAPKHAQKQFIAAIKDAEAEILERSKRPTMQLSLPFPEPMP